MQQLLSPLWLKGVSESGERRTKCPPHLPLVHLPLANMDSIGENLFHTFMATGMFCPKARCFLAALIFLFAVGISCAEVEPDLFLLRSFDEVILKDGTKHMGKLIDTAPGQYDLKILKSNATIPIKDSEVNVIFRKATQDTEWERLSREFSGRPPMILKMAQEAIRRNFNQLLPTKLIALLEKEANKDPDLLALLCEQYLNTNQSPLALKTAEALINSATTKVRGYVLRGQAYLDSGNVDAAGLDFEKAYKDAPDDEQVLVARANFLLVSGRASEAKEMFSTALAKSSRNISACIGLGRVQLRQGEFVDAEKSFQKALDIDSKHKQARCGLAVTKLMNKQYDEAYREANSVLSVDNRSAEAYAIQALAKLFSGDQGSMLIFERKIAESFKEKPNQPRLTLAHAAGLEREAKYAEALNPKDGAAAAKILRDKADLKYKEVLSSDASDSYIQYFIGEWKFQKGDYPAAESAFQRCATKLSPRYAPVHAALGATHLKLGKWESARDSYQKAAEIDSSMGDYQAGKGLSFLGLLRFEDASKAFREASKLDARCVAALCGLGYVANFEKNKTGAIDFFQKALAADGSCGYAADALTKIFAQESMSLEYLTFDDNKFPPPGWKSKGSAIQISAQSSQILFAGTQGASTGSIVELFKDVAADEFVRLEADLTMDPNSTASFGLRLASGSANANFYVQLGKDEGSEVKVRYKDYSGQADTWKPLNAAWPTEGRVRLAIHSEDLKTGAVSLWINGKSSAKLELKLQKPSKLTAGVFLVAAPNSSVRATVDNIALLIRHADAQEKGNADPLTLTNDRDKTNGPQPPRAEDKTQK